MKKYQIIILITILIFLILFGSYVYYFNQDFNRNLLEQKLEIQRTKNDQNKINNDFNNWLKEHNEGLMKQEFLEKTKDEDNDGLTYEEELILGTNDNEKDSDGDGIGDKDDIHPVGGGKIHIIDINWTHQQKSYITQFGIAEDKYSYYKNKDRSPCCDGWKDFVIADDSTIQTIAKDVSDVSLITGDTNIPRIVINFVRSMVYEFDIDYNSKLEYPKYPIETIIDQRGDCEDTSFLMGSILEALGYDTVLLIYSNHAAIGLECDNCEGAYYEFNDKKYFFLETTGAVDYWKIGYIDDKYAQESPKIIDV